MTTEQIIKALEWYKKLECGICYDVGMLCQIGNGDCIVTLAETTLDIVNRQRAEIDQLNTLAMVGMRRAKDYQVMRNKAITARTEAIKEFAERLQENVTFHIDDFGEFVSYVDCRDMRNLVAEMVGADNE